MLRDRAQGAFDIADMSLVEDGTRSSFERLSEDLLVHGDLSGHVFHVVWSLPPQIVGDQGVIWITARSFESII